MLPTSRQLQYLVALADHLHFGQAARACHVTQPALSDQIRALEETVGVQLFERTRRQVIPTPLGLRLAERARSVLRDMGDLVETARAGRALFASPIRLGVIPTIAPYLLPPLLQPLRRDLPDLRLLLREEKTPVLLEQLREGRLDLLLLALLPGLDDLETLPLYREDFVLVVPRRHPWAGRESIDAAELQGEALLLLEEGHCLREQALEFCRMAGARDSSTFQASSLGTLAQMVANGIGVTLLPRLAADRELRVGEELRAIPFRQPAPNRRVGLLWRRTSGRAEEFRILAGAIRRRLPAAVQPLDPAQAEADALVTIE